MEVPTGGKRSTRSFVTAWPQARERPATVTAAGVSRSGAIPEPTVTVRMKENRARRRCLDRSGVGAFLRPDSGLRVPGLEPVSLTMNQSTASLASSSAAGVRRIAAISASWHTDIVHQARDAFVAELGRSGVAAKAVEHFDVPGAFEIPLLARRLAESGHYDAIVAFGLVVDGGVYRHDFVATAVIDGLMRVQLDSGVPVLSAVLTPHQFHEHATHREWFTAHFVIKGQEAARATLQTVALHQRVSTLTAR